MDYNIDFFDPRRLWAGDSKIVCADGKRRSGKSTTLSCWAYFGRHAVERAYLLSYSEHLNHDWDDIGKPGGEEPAGIIPSSYCFRGWDEGVVSHVMQQNEEEKEASGAAPRTLILAEDCFAEKEMTQSKALNKIHIMGRHFDIDFWYTSQHYSIMPRGWRKQLDFVALFGTNDVLTQEMYYKSCGGMFPSFPAFRRVFAACTSNWGECLVIDQSRVHASVEECVFYFRATPAPSYALGCEEYWQAHYDEQLPSWMAKQPASKGEAVDKKAVIRVHRSDPPEDLFGKKKKKKKKKKRSSHSSAVAS